MHGLNDQAKQVLSFPALGFLIACAAGLPSRNLANTSDPKSALSPQGAFLALKPEPVAPFDTNAWFASLPESYRRFPRHTLPGGGFMIGAEYTPQYSLDSSEKASRNPSINYLESVSPAAADKIIIYGYARQRRIEIQDTVVRIRYGASPIKIENDTVITSITRKEKENLDRALAKMPGGSFWSPYLLDCDGPSFYLSAYGVKRILMHSCIRLLHFAPVNPFEILGPLLRLACQRQGIPDVTEPRLKISEETLQHLDVPDPDP